jgi:hypothetical protein
MISVRSGSDKAARIQNSELRAQNSEFAHPAGLSAVFLAEGGIPEILRKTLPESESYTISDI